MPPNIQTDLSEWRKHAAFASNGTSSGPIVQSVMAEVLRSEIGVSILDFGAGTGNLIQALHRTGWAGLLVGADLYGRPASLPDTIGWVQADLNNPIPLDANTFDVIVSTEVIEHLENPRAVAREWARLLKPGGKLIVTTPNQESIRSLLSLLVSGHFVQFQDSCYPAHITALLRKDFERILTEAGFKQIQFSFVPHGGVPKFPHISWSQISMGLLNGRWFSDNVIVCGELSPI